MEKERNRMDNRDQAIEELTLMLLYLTSWRERGIDEHIRRSWKGYDFDALGTLAQKDFLSDSRRSKSVYLTPEGIDKAKRLLAQYGLGEAES